MDSEWERIMRERFGKDSLIALATVEDGVPYVRTVNAYYKNGAFYIVTYGKSNKMRQLAKNPVAAISGEWFSGHGEAADLGFFGNPANAGLAETLIKVFSGWINNGHSDLNDVNTRILRVRLTDGVLFSNGTRVELISNRKESE